MNRPDYLPTYLTEQQLDAILYRGGPLLIIAGPGSGKTEVIAWRVAHLIRAGHVRPEECLVTTFTNKAALELKDRIQQKLPGINVELMQVSTIHSFCADLLRRYQRGGSHLLDAEGQFLFVYANRKALGLGDIVKGRPYSFFSQVIATFNQATEELVEPDKLLAHCEAGLCACCADESDLWQERAAVAEAYRRYCDLLRERRLTDFAFLQRHALDLLTGRPDVLAELQERFHEILVDEYQDTNALQDRLLELIAGDGGHLTVVGDDDQSIYRFRGATVKNILTFPDRFPGAHVVRLTQNFRSREPILDHSQRVIVHNPARYPKDLFTRRGPGSDIVLVYRRTAGEEAVAVADFLKRLHDAGKIRRWSDVALLLRSVRSYAEPYVAAFAVAGIPHVVTGDATFFKRDDISQLYRLFSFLGASKPWGDVHLRQPIVGLSAETRGALKRYKDNLLDVATDAGLRGIGVQDAGDRERLLALLKLKKRVQDGRHNSLIEVFYSLLAATGYFARCEQEGREEAQQNLGVLSRLVAAFDEYGGTRNFYPFMNYLKLMKEGGVDPVTVPPEDAVQVMTVHQAKGLEFPVVVVGALMEGRFPSRRRKERYEIPADMKASGSPEVNDPHLVDERRLFYVAVTRARELLILGTADVVNKRGGGPSRFLNEMLGDDLQAVADLERAFIAEAESRGGAPLGPRERHSFSQLAYFLQCPLRYKYAVIYGLETPWPAPAGFGANVHRALEEIHNRARAGYPPGEADVADIVAETWVPGPGIRPEMEQALQEAAVRQLREYVRRHANTFSRIERAEAPFSFSLGEHILLGKIDLIRRADEGGVEIVDFKTAKSSPLTLGGIDAQLDLYALGVETDLGERVRRQTVHFLGDGQVVTWKWSAKRAGMAREGFATILERITRREFTPRTAYCPTCQEFAAICPYALEHPGPAKE